MFNRTGIALVVFTGLVMNTSGPQAGLQDLLKPMGQVLNQGASSAAVAPSTTPSSALSTQEMNGGLKEALSVGVQRAIELLGRDGGYLNDKTVRIPLPGVLAKAESGLRMVGQGKLADEFITTMNRAAERAVPEAASIFADAIRSMTLQDAQGILQGPDDAATQYFRTTSGERLAQAIAPIVKDATEQAGVTSAYKRMVGGSGMLGGMMGGSALDLDKYVTDKTLDGLFFKLAAEEKAIRQNPLARSTDLLKKVFGSLGN